MGEKGVVGLVEGVGMGDALVVGMTKTNRRFQARLLLTSPGTLLGGSKSHSSIYFDSREDAAAWLKQAVEINIKLKPDAKIQGRIVERVQ